MNGENRIDDYLVLPKFKDPNTVEDFHIKFTGKKVQGTKKVQRWLDAKHPPQYVMDRFSKSEKAVDTQICCDALQLASNSRIERLFLYTNDFDFMPLADTLKSMGCNVSLFRLFKESTNIALIENTDAFCVPHISYLRQLFDIKT